MTTPTPPTPPTTTLEQVKRSAPGMSVGKLDRASVGERGVDTPGVDIFELSDPKAPPADGNASHKIVAIAGGVGSPILEDPGAILRAVDAGTKDAVVLARVGLIVNRRDYPQLLVAATTEQERKMNVTAPTRTGSVVEMWFYTGGMGRTLTHARLDLATGKLDRIEPPPPNAKQAVANAIAELASSPSPSQRGYALKTLAASCSDPAASKAFFGALANHASDEIRAAAADAAPACGAAAVAPLIHALEHDKARLVRGKAALALGTIGDRKAIPALEKAATTDIASAVKIALGKLK